MFSMFRKRPSTYSQSRQTRESKLTIFTRRLQTRWAEGLSRQDRKLTMRQRKLLLCLFTLLMSGLSTYWIYRGIIPPQKGKPSYLHHQAITTPETVSLPDSLDLNLLKAYQRWQTLKDSLSDSSKR